MRAEGGEQADESAPRVSNQVRRGQIETLDQAEEIVNVWPLLVVVALGDLLIATSVTAAVHDDSVLVGNASSCWSQVRRSL